MTVYKQFILSGTLLHPNIFRLRLLWAFFDAWFTQKKLLTELHSPVSGELFSFVTIFQNLKIVRFRSYSKLKLFFRCNLQWWKRFVDILFHLGEISKEILGNIKETGLILSSESVNLLKRGVVAAVRVVKNHSKITRIVFFLYLLQFVFIPFPLLCASTLATELWNHNFTIFRKVITFVFIFRQLLTSRMQWKSPNLFLLECSLFWWKPFCSICDSLWENGCQS